MAKMIKDLGNIYPKPESKTKYRVAIYECDECKTHVQRHVRTVEKSGRALCDTCANKLKVTPLKPILQEDYKMRIVKDLGRIPDATGKNNHEAIFECVKCKEHLQKKVSSKQCKEQEYCIACSNSFNNVKHGLYSTRVYKIWRGMYDRCNNVNKAFSEYYISKGIKVCDEWKTDFEAFYKWSMENGYEDTLTIDRINPEEDYSPSNCRWATRTTQQRNTTDIQKNNTSGYRGVSLTTK